MSRVAYVDGRYVPHGRATTHIEDRGYQFADGIYEVIAIAGGRMVDGEGHLVRLHIGLEDAADLIADLEKAFARLSDVG